MALSAQLDNIQKLIISIHRQLFEESPTPMKLQKLCYYAQGYALAGGEELFPDDFQAWQHGPVVVDLYAKYKDYQWRQITEPLGDEGALAEEPLSLVTEVVSAYGRYDGAALSTMTHRELPWLSVRGDLDESVGCSATIPKELLHNFFAEKLRANG